MSANYSAEMSSGLRKYGLLRQRVRIAYGWRVNNSTVTYLADLVEVSLRYRTEVYGQPNPTDALRVVTEQALAHVAPQLDALVAAGLITSYAFPAHSVPRTKLAINVSTARLREAVDTLLCMPELMNVISARQYEREGPGG